MKEQAIVFGRAQPLVGVAIRPDGASRGTPGVLFLNAGLLPRAGPNRLYVDLARRFGELGFPSLRFDQSGLGDSAPRRDGLPLSQSILKEGREAIDCLSGSGPTAGCVLVGLCSGADAAYRIACADDRVRGVVSIGGFPYRTLGWYARHYGPRLRHWRCWRDFTLKQLARLAGRGVDAPAEDSVSGERSELTGRDLPGKREAAAGLDRLIRRGVQFLFIYTSSRLDNYNHQSQFARAFRSVPFDGKVEVAYFPESDHTFTLICNQERLRRTIEAWMGRFL